MSTYSSIDTYRDPEQASIANTLGTAMTYLQKNYDENTLQTQELIDKYVGTDLLRDVDKQYLGERLNTLVDYVNQSGSRNWTKKNTARQIQNYISTAIDGNVAAAVASTRNYRQQQETIEAYKKAGKGEYAAQNEWMATRDLQRYLKSTELGDVYRAGTYIPYKNVSEKILKHADKLKDFGIEYTPFQGSSDGYFRMIGTKESLSPAKVQQFLGSILDASDMQQLQIDGLYSTKDLSDTEIKNSYHGLLDRRTQALQDNIESHKLMLPSATKADKEQIQARIDSWTQEIEGNEARKQRNMGRDTMAASYYVSQFMDKYTDFMSFERVKDFKIDDSMFQLYKYNTDIAQKNIDRSISQKRWEAEQDLAVRKMEMDAYFKGAKLGQDGNITVDPSNPYYNAATGVSIQQEETKLDEKVQENEFRKEEASFNESYVQSISVLAQGLKSVLDQPGNETLKQQYGGISNNRVLGKLVNSPSRTVALYNILPPDVRTRVDQLRSQKKSMDRYDTHITEIQGVTDKIAQAITSSKTKDDTKKQFQRVSFGMTLDDKGNLVQGDVLAGKGKYQKLARELTALNYAMSDPGLDRFGDDMAILQRAFRKKLAESDLSTDQQKKLIKDFMRTPDAEVGVLNDIAQGVTGFFKSLGAAWRGESAPSSTQTTSGANRISFGRDVLNRLHANASTNANIAALGNSAWMGASGKDIDVEDPGALYSKIKEQLNNVKTVSKSSATTRLTQSINVSSENKNSQAIAQALAMVIPQGTELQKGGYFKVTVSNPESGMADVTASVKTGKNEYSPVVYQVPVANLPTELLKNVSLTPQTNSIYSATNPNSVGYSQSYELPKNASEVAAQLSQIPIEQRMSGAVPQYVTQAQLEQKLAMVAPPELLKQHSQELKEIVNGSYSVNLIPVNGEWVTQVKKDGQDFAVMRTGQAQYNPETMRLAIPTIVTEAIESRIKAVMGIAPAQSRGF